MKKIYFFLLLGFIRFGVVAQIPVAYYPFNGNANDAIGTLNGTVSGAILSSDRFGSSSTTFRFDGVDDNIDLGNSAVIRPTADLTISAWFNLENTVGAIAGRQILSCTENSGYQVAYDKALNAFVLYVRRNGSYGFVQTPAAPYLTGWHYMAGTFDGRFTRLYMDGVLVGTDDAGATFPIQYFSGVKTYIGAEASDPIATGVPIDLNYYWQGRIDEVKIYATALTAPQILQEYTTNVGPVAHYPFNGNANDAIGTNNGTANGGAALTADRFGNTNSAYNFDGVNDAISFTSIPMTNTNNFTLMAWVNPAVFDPTNQFNKMIISLGPGNNGYNMGMGNNSGSGGGNQLGGLYNIVSWLPSGSFFSTINTWYHVAMVRESGITKFYLNGVQAPNTFASTPLAFSNAFQIGGQDFDPTHFWNGKIDEVKIYNTALTASQVQQDFSSSNQTQKPGSGNAMSFDGINDKITINDNPNINFAFNQDFTVDCWVKIPSTNQPNTVFNFNGILQKWDNGAAPYPYQIWFINHVHPNPAFRNKITVNRFDGVNNPGIVSNLLLNDDKFHHIAFTKRGAVLELFIDGITQGTIADNTTGNTTNTLPLIVGGAPNGSIPLDGDIDEVRIWRAGMIQTEIRDRMCKKITSTDPLYSNLVAYYNFDESTGTTALDGTINANNGTLENTPTRVTSGAAIGNVSSHDYVNATKTVSLTHFSGENLTVNSTSGAPEGIQTYLVEEQPNNLTGASGVGVNNKYFGVLQVGGTAPQYTAVYNYNGNPLVVPAIESQLRLNRRTDNTTASWTLLATIPNEVANTITVTGENTEYILGRLGGSLPLNLISFTGSRQNFNALLQWKTSNEVNVIRFEIQRSYNGIEYTNVGTVSAGDANYSYSDINAFASRSVAFYRLKSIDADGKFTYSGIVKLNKQETGKLNIFPNPVKDLMIIGGINQNGTLLLFNAEGKLLLQKTVTAPTLTIDMSGYATGTYWLQFEHRGTKQIQKLIKQ